MTERVPCTACGARILPDTAAKNGGLCMPCRNGYRKNIEQSLQRREAEKAERESPARKHWEWLVRQVHQTPAGFAGLSRENQLFFAACMLEGEVYNGGFDQYFTNSSADHFLQALEGLAAMGATECARLLCQAKDLFFGAAEVPPTQAGRWAAIRASAMPADERARKSDALDTLFYEDRDGFQARAESYADKHGLRAGF